MEPPAKEVEMTTSPMPPRAGRHPGHTPSELRTLVPRSSMDAETTPPGPTSAMTTAARAAAPDFTEETRRQVPAKEIVLLAKKLGLSKKRLYELLGFPRSTVDRQIAANRPLSPDLAKHFLEVRGLAELVEQMVNESGNPEGFDAAAWLGGWLHQPQPALGGVPPADYLHTQGGISSVRDLLLRTQSGAYA